MQRNTKVKDHFFVLLILVAACFANGSAYFVDPNGNDSSDGSIDHPFKTIPYAVGLAMPGDTIYLRGGTHRYTSKISLAGNGTSTQPKTMQAYQDEVPVIDFTGQPYGSSNRGISLSASYWHLKGFIIQHAGDNGLIIGGSYNLVEQMVTRMNSDSGLQLEGTGSYNLVLNCDSYLNCDAPSPNFGENADGFAVKSTTIGPGNIMRGCRSWNNSDDGFDFYYATGGIRLEDCWAFRNGINLWGLPTWNGDGNGFKLGDGAGPHVLIRCVAYDNPHNGIDVNGNTTGVTVYNCTGVKNAGPNFYFDEHSSSHVLRNNISHRGTVNIYAEIDDLYNSWNGFTVTDADFTSFDANGIDGPRQSDGELPEMSFLHLAAGSNLIDGGTNVGLPYSGIAPDLGAFEHIGGDCQPDGEVDLADLQCLADNWLSSGCGTCNGADFDGDSGVDAVDFAVMAENWME